MNLKKSSLAKCFVTDKIIETEKIADLKFDLHPHLSLRLLSIPKTEKIS